MVEFEYAKALFDLAIEERKMELFHDTFNTLLDVTETEQEFFKLMSSPVISKKEKISLVEECFYKFDKTFLNFLKVLVEHQRFACIKSIFNEYLKLERDYNHILKVEVISSTELTASRMSIVKKGLKKRFPGQVLHIENTVNPRILGGMQIICNGESLDMSLKYMLTKMKDSL